MAHYDIELTPSGETFYAEPDENVLDAALRAGILLPYGCRNGACGSCKGKILTGEIGYDADEPVVLTDAERRAGWALLCQAKPKSGLRIEADPINRDGGVQARNLPVRVFKKTLLADDVMQLELQLPPTERLQFLAGQYIDIVMRDGRRRAFSLANSPHHDGALTLHIRHVPGGSFSGHVFGELKARALMRIEGPLGGFYLRESARPAILIAGGTGFAPIKSIVESALFEQSTRTLHIYWGARARDDLYLHDTATEWSQHVHLTYTPVLSEPKDDDSWTGRTGFVHTAVLEDFPDLGAYDIYASGPPIMVNAIRDGFPGSGADIERIFSDSFDYAFETGHDA